MPIKANTRLHTRLHTYTYIQGRLLLTHTRFMGEGRKEGYKAKGGKVKVKVVWCAARVCGMRSAINRSKVQVAGAVVKVVVVRAVNQPIRNPIQPTVRGSGEGSNGVVVCA